MRVQQITRACLLQRFLMCFLLLGVTSATISARAQKVPPSATPSPTGSKGISGTSLPDEPSASLQESTSVSGTILDTSGAAVQGAEVTLTEIGTSHVRSTVTQTDGSFRFSRLLPGSYIVAVKASGFQRTTSAIFVLGMNQAYQMPNIVLSIAGSTTEIVVRPTEVIAAQQIKVEEKQRVLSIIPNFYTSYIWDAAPLNTRQKFSLIVRDTFDPFTFVGVSIGAGIEQANNAFPGYGQGTTGYGKRWGALFANGRSSEILSRAVFASLLHQDPRYFYQGSGSTWSRTKHAVSNAFVARSDSGRTMPNYSYFLGNICSGALSNLYYPASSRGASLVFTNAAIGFAGRAGEGLVQEFLFKRLTRNVPGSGKPVRVNQ
jgi:hypothetical protein